MNADNNLEFPGAEVLEIYRHLSISPMPPEGTDLSGVILTRSQRLWLGIAVGRGYFKTRELADKWNMKYQYVWKLSKKVRVGIIPAEKVGRPRVIDSEGMAILRSFVRTHGTDDKKELKETADTAYTDTYKRRRRELEEVGDVHLVMKKRSRCRYVAAVTAEGH